MITDTPLPITVPPINRCRGFFAYTAQGERYLDLFLEHGSLVPGHRIKGIGTGLKNFLEKGAWGHYPTVWRTRAEKSLLGFFETYSLVSFFPGIRTATEILARETGNIRIDDPAGPGSLEKGMAKACIWRPHLPAPVSYEYLIPWLPYSGSLLPVTVLSTQPLETGYQPPAYQLSVMPKLLAFMKAYVSEDFSGFWKRMDHPLWTRNGPYIFPNIDRTEYGRLFDFFLRNRIILSPDINGPSVLPDTLSDGEIAKFIRTSEDFYGRI